MHGGYVAEIEHLDQPESKRIYKRKKKLHFRLLG